MTVEAVKMPALPLTGGCQCGAVRYTIAEAPRAFYLCHCTECQRQTSSAFGMSLRCDPASVTITGPLKSSVREADSGAVRYGDFCPECGVRIQHRSKGDPSRLNIKAGTLDDCTWLIPAGHIWTASRQRHVTIPDEALAYLHQPDDGARAIMERWQGMLAAGREAS